MELLTLVLLQMLLRLQLRRAKIIKIPTIVSPGASVFFFRVGFADLILPSRLVCFI
jgi:hypothetical protein